jgi:hypothetical protein
MLGRRNRTGFYRANPKTSVGSDTPKQFSWDRGRLARKFADAGETPAVPGKPLFFRQEQAAEPGAAKKSRASCARLKLTKGCRAS